ncbi:MAG: hypothetical protein PHU06_11240 [Gallionella sp.]|nr:hypothetical protein [Gallionella sp.]MDD4959842.1 hypothetical protein [Gallionella sp.]
MRDIPVEFSQLIAQLVSALQAEADRYAATDCAPKIASAKLHLTQIKDPYNQLPSYEGIWRNTRHDRCGALTINSDGSVYAEFDMFCPHPRDKRWFVEMVTAWGREDALRYEAKLIPSLEE